MIIAGNKFRKCTFISKKMEIRFFSYAARSHNLPVIIQKKSLSADQR